MIRADEIQDKLLHLIGWQQNYDTTNLKIAESLTESESGLYYQQVHPLLTLQNLSCIAPDFQNIRHETYEEGRRYAKGNIVEWKGKLYRALQDCEGCAPTPDAEVCDLVWAIKAKDEGGYERVGEPERINCRSYDSRYRTVGETTATVTDTAAMKETVKYELVDIELGDKEPYEPGDYWKETDLFSEWLEGKTKASIYKAVMRFLTEKMAAGAGTALCENRALFDGTGRLADRVRNRGRFVGFEIVPVRSKGVTTKINKIGLQFTKPGKYTLYLFHSSASEPVRTIEVEKKAANGIEWFAFQDLYLPYATEMTDAGGSWYLGYLQDDLPEGSEAVRKERDWSKGPCKDCSRREFLAWEAWSKYLEVHPFYVDGKEVAGLSEDPDGPGAEPRLWDVADNVYTYDTNYGLNLEVSVGCDYTDFIIEQRSMFQDVIAKQVAVDMLREFAFNSNVRTNRHSVSASRVDILYELDGDSGSMKKSGLCYLLDQAYKALRVDTSGIDRICLPCKNNGVKYRTV